MSGVDRVLEALRACGHRDPVRTGSGWKASCPVPDHGKGMGDRAPSLSVWEDDQGWAGIKCHAGCERAAILEALGLGIADIGPERPDLTPSPGRRPPRRAEPHPEPGSLPSEEKVREWVQALAGNEAALARLAELRGWSPESLARLEVGFDGERLRFPIRDARGTLLNVCAYTPKPANGRPKQLSVRGRPRGLYPPPETLPDGEPVWIVEGEPDAVSGTELGLAATGLPGVNGWKAEYAERFDGRDVVVCLDADAEGRKAAERVAEALCKRSKVRSLRVLPSLDEDRADGYDLTDYLLEAKAGGGQGIAAQRKTLEALAADAPAETLATADDRPDGLYAVSAASIEPEEVEWLFPQRVPLGAITLVVGDPGLGKTLWTCHLAAQVTTGAVGDGPSRVLMVTAEDSISAVLRPRLDAAGANPERVAFVQVRRDGFEDGLRLPDDAAELGELVARHRARLLVVDPLMAHLPENVNSFRDQSVRTALAPLHRIAEDNACAVVVVAHLNKGMGADPLYRTGGSVGIPAAARSALLMARDPDDGEGDEGSLRVLAHFKSNYGPKAPSLSYEVEVAQLEGGVSAVRVRERGESGHGAPALLATVDGEERSALGEAAEFLRTELANGPVPAKEIKVSASGAGIAERTLKRAKSKLGVEAHKGGFKGVWEWHLPEGGQASKEGMAPLGHGPLRESPHSKRDSEPSGRPEIPEGGQFRKMAPFDGSGDDSGDAGGPVWTFGEAG